MLSLTLHSRLKLFARARRLVVFAMFCCAPLTLAQQSEKFDPVPRFQLSDNPLKIAQVANSSKPFTVAGELGGIFGRQDGRFELWSFPVKVLQHFEIIAELDGYPVPIFLNEQSATIEVFPDHTTITYSHAAIVVKQHMFALRDPSQTMQGTGVIVLFEIAAVRPATLTFRCTPALTPQWPAPQFGTPSASWVKFSDSGGYLLATSNPQLFGMIAMPRTAPGILPPYQEQPRSYPLEFKLAFDPHRDSEVFFPLLATVSYNQGPLNAEATNNLIRQIATLDAQVPQLYEKTKKHYANFLDSKMAVESPDPKFDKAFRWAELAVDQSQANFHGETGLVAGWYSSGDSARPGFGWFFGRDTLWSLFAVNSYGDFSLGQKAFHFLINRQRADGKIMHEFSQTADQVDWEKTPYFYASADSTPLFVIAFADYVRASGDITFLRDNWEHVKRAYLFTRAHDSDGDGIYDNSEGTGWVESWPPKMPHQELYLAALDQQSAAAISSLAKIMGDEKLSTDAAQQANAIREKLSSYRQRDGFYAFSKNADGSYDSTATIFPSVAWWTGSLALPDADAMLQRWASPEFFTDWGARSVSNKSALYDPLSYHQGTVWPLFTGWVSLAEYRAGHPLAGYQQLMSTVNLTWAQDLGAVTELLSGEFFEPLGRSTSHQLWSSAMLLSPAIRGMFGLETDTPHKYLKVAPRLPAAWDHVTLRRVPLGSDGDVDVTVRRAGAQLLIDAESKVPKVLCIATSDAPIERDCDKPAAFHHTAAVDLPPVEVALETTAASPGAVTRQMKILEERYSAASLTLRLAAPGGSTQILRVRFNGNSGSRKPSLRVTGALLEASGANLQGTGGLHQVSRDRLPVTEAGREGDVLRVTFPAGAGYQEQVVTVQWTPLPGARR
jgi:glycogen debranching enzyme